MSQIPPKTYIKRDWLFRHPGHTGIINSESGDGQLDWRPAIIRSPFKDYRWRREPATPTTRYNSRTSRSVFWTGIR